MFKHTHVFHDSCTGTNLEVVQGNFSKGLHCGLIKWHDVIPDEDHMSVLQKDILAAEHIFCLIRASYEKNL